MSWFFDAVGSGFTRPVSPAHLQYFRILYGTVLTARFALSFGQGGWDRLAAGSLTASVVQDLYPGRSRVLFAAYRPLLVLRALAAPALALGQVPRLALAVVLAGLGMELLYLRSPNAVRYSILTGCCLLLAGDLGRGLAIGHTPSTANTWAQCLMVLITTDIYWNSAWQKLHSRQFRSGLYLAQWVHVNTVLRERLRYRGQYAIPGPVRRYMGNLERRDIALWRLVSAVAVALEIALPPALVLTVTRPYAVVVGIAMHAAFTCLKPRQLITFSGLTVGSYLAAFA